MLTALTSYTTPSNLRVLPTPPCGPCRQVLYEFNSEMKIHLGGRDNKEVFRLKDLLPHAFVSKQEDD
jgi:cytidine deaminase